MVYSLLSIDTRSTDILIPYSPLVYNPVVILLSFSIVKLLNHFIFHSFYLYTNQLIVTFYSYYTLFLFYNNL
nr:MAG TPA: hypothetical protein [Myoviridae sp. ctNPX13]